MYQKLLVAVDESERALKALQQAVGLADILAAKVVAIYVLRPGDFQDPAEKGLSKEALEQKRLEKQVFLQEKLLQKIEEEMPGVLARIEFVTRVGRNTAKIIVGFADENGCDLIVLGSRNLPGASSLIMRSVTNDVLGLGKNVLVVR